MQCEFHGGDVLHQMGEGRFYALSQLHGEIVPFLIDWLHTMLPVSCEPFEGRSFAEHQVKTTFSDFCLLLPHFTSYRDIWSFFFTRLVVGVHNRAVAMKRAPGDRTRTVREFEPGMPGCLLIGYPFAIDIIKELNRQRYEVKLDE